MNPNTLITVHGYAGDSQQVEDNMRFYTHHGCPVVVMSPEDSPITASSHPGIVFRIGGRRQHAGPLSIERQKIHMRMMLEYPWDFVLMNDSDSFIISPEIPRYLYERDDVFWSTEVQDTNPSPSLLPKIALQPPYFTSRKVLKAMVEVFERPLPVGFYYWYPDPPGCIDGWIYLVAVACGYPHFSYRQSLSHNTHAGFETGLQLMANAVRDQGCAILHSVKTREAGDYLRGARRLYAEAMGLPPEN